MAKTNIKPIIFLLGLLLVAGGAITLVTTRGEGTKGDILSPASALTTPEKSFDFATISMKNGKVTHRFEVKNTGSESVRILKVATSCMCTTATVIDSAGANRGTFGMPGHTSPKTNIEVRPGESAFIDAVFDPAAHGPSGVGLADRSVYLETNSAATPQLELTFRAVVTQ